MKTFKQSQHGLSLIELMIAITIGALLLAGTAGLLISNKRIYRDQNEMGRLQENARFAMEMLIKDIRRVGYTGCMDRPNDVNNSVNGTGAGTSLLNMTNPIEGSENASNWYPTASTEGVGDMVAGTDGITIKFMEPSGDDITLTAEMPNVSAELKVTDVSDFQIGEIIAIGDCDGTDIMQLTNIQDSSSSLQHAPGGSLVPGNATGSLTKTYMEGAQIMRFVTRRYFISTHPVTGELGLYMYAQDRGDYDGDGDINEFITQELIEGVENMQILFGEDTVGDDGIADTYVKANAVGNWGNVVSAKIALLMRTVKEDFTAPLNTDTYALLDEPAIDPPDDHRRRRVFSSTIDIRNRSN